MLCSTATPSAPAPPIPTVSLSPCAWACSAARIRARPGRTSGLTAFHRSPMDATSRCRRRIRARSMLVSASRRHRKTARSTAAKTSPGLGNALTIARHADVGRPPWRCQADLCRSTLWRGVWNEGWRRAGLKCRCRRACSTSTHWLVASGARVEMSAFRGIADMTRT